MGTENEPEEKQTQKKKIRHRKKHVYNAISQQMEFYFSDSNLNKDRFLGGLIKENPCINLEVFLKFNKIRKLTTSIEDIRKAIKHSHIIEVTEDGNSVKRKIPVKQKANVEECTIYVEKLKADVTHEWLTSVFSDFGKVVYVSLPKYKHNSAIKGFGFVEFDTEEGAQATLEFFDGIGCKIPANHAPDELCSVSAFEEDNSDPKNTDETPPEENNQETDVDPQSKETTGARKRKHEPQTDDELQEEHTIERKRKYKPEPEEGTTPEEPDTKTDGSRNHEDDAEEIETKKLNTEVEIQTDSTKKKKKSKKEQKRKTYMKELGIHVLSKREWRKMRNKYLDLQRKRMKEFKKHLNKIKYSNFNYEEKPIEKKQMEDETSAPDTGFTEGLIVKIGLTEPCSDTKKLKNSLKAIEDVKYVDIPNPGTVTIYLRFATKEGAATYCALEGTGTKEILTGDEEHHYWNRLTEYRQNKTTREVKKRRGRDKLLKKANKLMGQHIKFDD